MFWVWWQPNFIGSCWVGFINLFSLYYIKKNYTREKKKI